MPTLYVGPDKPRDNRAKYPFSDPPAPGSAESFFRIPFGTALATWLLAITMFGLGLLDGQTIGRSLLLFAIASGLYLSIVDHTWNAPTIPRAWWKRILFVALLGRVAMLLSPAVLSDDIYRHLWEGRVVASGANPYALAPDSDALFALRDENWLLIENPSRAATSPPLSQAAFAAVAEVGGGVLGIKLLMVVAELAAAGLLWRWLRRAGLPEGRVLVWLFHPLVLVEIAGSGHDVALLVLGVAAMFLALQPMAGEAVVRGKHALLACAGLFVAAGTSIVPAMYVAHVARRLSWRGRVVAVLVPLLFAATYLPFRDAGVEAFRSFAHVEAQNASVYRLVRSGIESIDGAAPPSVAWGLCVSIYAGVFILALCRSRWPWEKCWLVLWGGLLILSPVCQPWHLLPLLPCAMRRFRAPVMWWTLTACASYLPLDGVVAGEPWRESLGAWWLQYGGLLVLCVWEWRHARPATITPPAAQ